MTAQQADYLRIPLLDGGFGLAQVFEIAPSRPGALFLGIASHRIGPDDTPAPLSLAEITALCFTTDIHVTSGHWPIAGFDQIPRFRPIFDYDGAAALDFPDHPVHDPAVIEAFINAVHGLYPWDGFGDLFDRIHRADIARPDTGGPGPTA